MSKTVRKWMPIWIGDYLAETGHLTTQQHGAYLLMLMHYWNTQKPLPDVDSTLALIARLSVKEWKKDRPFIANFFQVVDGNWYHSELVQKIDHAAGLSEKRRKVGRIGGKKRWEGRNDG